ncbi:hypothetical protein CLOM_g8640 [Closterium sp. NIES-68]|nr:hypothetical protein CLOM_g8640 [Closterium sp. NIES-68]GJP67391.1 hypothetical protein CLOP_g24209 [Closterium sp. NIES-67]
MPLFAGRVVAGLVLVSVLLAALPVDAAREMLQVKPSAKPTRADILKEIKVATTAVKKVPGYKRVATLLQAGIPQASQKYDFTVIYNGTLLAGNDDALKVLMKKINIAKPGDLDRVFGMLLQMTLKGNYSDATLTKKPMIIFPTNGPKPLRKMTARNAATTTFGIPGTAAATWATIITPKLYVGKWFTVHGVNYFIL